MRIGLAPFERIDKCMFMLIVKNDDKKAWVINGMHMLIEEKILLKKWFTWKVRINGMWRE